MPKTMSNRNILPLLENFIIDLIEIPKILGTLYLMSLFPLKFKQLLPVLTMPPHEYVVSYSMNDIYESE